MIDRVKHTFKHAFIYSIGNFFVKFVGLILLPIYTSHLTVSQYGIMAILETTQNLLMPLFLMNIQAAVRRFFNESSDKKKQGTILYTALVYTLVIGIIANFLLQPFTRRFSLLLFDDPSLKIYFTFLFINISLQGLFSLIRMYYNAVENSFKFSLINIVYLILVLVLTIYFIVVLRWGIKGWLVAQTISYVIVITIFLKEYLKYSVPNIDLSLLKEMLNYSIPIAFSLISSIVLSFGDRYVLNFLLGKASVGIYSLSVKLVNVIDIIVIQAFQLAYLPYAFRQFKTENFKSFHSRLTTYLIFIIVSFALALSLYSKGLLRIFAPSNPQYWQAVDYVAFLAFLKVIVVFRFMSTLSLHITKKTKIIPVVVTFAALLNIVLNVLFIPRWGIYGAIVASFISSFLMNIAFYFISQKQYKFFYEFRRLAILIVLGIVIYLFGSMVHIENLFIHIFIKSLFILAYIVLLRLIGFFTKEELNSIKGFIEKWKNPKKWKNQASDIF